MKKSFILFLVLGVGRVFSQTSIAPSPFSFNLGSAQSFTTSSGDWAVDDGTGSVPSCTVGGSSGTFLFLGSNATGGGTVQTLVSPSINTNTYVNIFVSWNQFKATSGSPAVTAQWSNDNGNNWTNITYTAPSTGNWATSGQVALPAAASGTILVFRWFYTTTGTGSGADAVAVDDIRISGTPSPSYYYDGTGDLANVTNWGQNVNGSGANPPDFTTASQNFFIMNCTSATLASNWIVSGANTFLNVGDGTVPNKCQLIIPSGFALTVGNGSGTDAKLVVNNSSTLTIQNTTFPSPTDVTLGTSSTVEFSQSSAVSIWGGATITYANLTLNGGGAKNQNGNLIVNGTFILGSGTNYVMESNINRNTTLSGSISCVGNITQGLSRLTIQGSSTIGSINFNGSGGIYNFTLNRSGQTMSLGTSIAVNNVTSLTNGTLNINGRALTLGGNIVFHASTSNGAIVGSATSSIVINGSGSITNGLLMDQTSAATRQVNAFTMDRATTTLILGSNLQINTLNHTNGFISLNDKSLTLNNVINFPASISNGAFVGSASSNVLINGSSGVAINNSLLMSQNNTASKTMGSFNMQRSNVTLVLGNDLIIGSSGSGSANFANGIIDLNGRLLTLSGNISFPGGPTNRGFRGSPTSSISIDASGSITGFMFMVQTSSSTRQLASFSLDRTGELVTFGNALETYGEILPIAGDLDTDVGNLYIRSNATSKGRIGPVLGGTITGPVNVETFALAGNTGWTNLGVSGVTGKTVGSWDGQIPMTCLSCINSPYAAGGTYFVSIQRWDETAPVSSTVAYVEQNVSSPLTPGAGFWTYLGNGATTTSDITWTVSGTVVQGDQDIALTNSGPSFGDGFNFIANPFPSPISWTSIMGSNTGTATGLDNAIYVYNPDAGSTDHFTAFSGFISDDPINGITDAIPMGQGFYVQAVNNYTLTIHETDKIKSNAPLLKTTDANIGSVIRLKVEDAGFGPNYTAIRFHGNATNGYDRGLDAHKLFSAPGAIGANSKLTTISTRMNGVDYAINSLPNAITQDAVIPVLIKARTTGQYTISGTSLENLPNSCVTLKDNLKNITYDLKSGPAVVTISDTETTPRFELRVCADISMSLNETLTSSQNILINQDANGVYVKLDYDKATKSTISVTNILGQKVMDNKSVTVQNDVVYLNIPEKHQLLFVTVTTDTQKVTKKVVR